MKKIIQLILIIACMGLFAACSGSGESDSIKNSAKLKQLLEDAEEIDLIYGFSKEDVDAYTIIDENNQLILKANLSNGEIVVIDKRSGKEWYSNPPDKETDGLASGFNRISLYSQVLVNYSTSVGVAMNVGSYNSSVTKDGLESRIDGGKVIFKYTFEREELVVPVRYSIDENALVAEIITGGVRENSTNKINSIEILPFFGAGSKKDTGYFVVPDGSGALIKFNNGKTSAQQFELNLYGFDNGTSDKVKDSAQSLKTSVTLSQNGYLPVFGEKCNNDGYLAVITKGDGRASIKARTADKYTSYNNIWTAYNYRVLGTVRLMQKEMTEQSTLIAEKKPETLINYEIKYLFLEQEKSGYSDMALAYQQYLVETEGLRQRTKEGDIPFYLDLYGYIVKTKSFLGIPKDTKIVMTSIDDAEAIAKKLTDNGVGNIILKYNHWMKDGYYSKIQTKAKVEGKIGTLSKMKELQEMLADSGGSLYLASDLVNIYKTGNKVSKYSNVLNSVANTPQMQYEFSLDTAGTDSRYKPWYLLDLNDLSKYMNTFINNFTNYGFTNAFFDGLGDMAYSDLGSNGLSRSRVPAIINDALNQAAMELDGIMVSGANSFSAVTAAHIINAPVRSSNYDITDENIPFYEMVFHGYVYYSIGASNLSSNPDDITLKCLEYGAYPMFSWVAQNGEELVSSRTGYLFSPDYTKWIDFAISQYIELNEALKDTITLPMTEHKILMQNLVRTTYGNKIQVLINYNAADVTYENYIIPAKGYLVISAE